ncbi:PAS domain S-box protein [Hydrogenophaga crocea]|uniref:PAS domain S-box protein n=1 Tax=Hydrogenophaga crocea TaxID=2716225 RepID=A0A6G8IK46_9BURK|nr:PAS domain S-box protein [Hydrogenophaga crocea]QIM53360.1 PAS domain S-box protein [Hydrogenophaga crocea]
MAEHRKRSVQIWLPLLPAAVAVLLLALVVWLVERIIGQELERRAGQRVEQVAEAFADQIARALARRGAELELVAGMPALGMGLDVWQQHLGRLRHSSPAYVWIGATDLRGTVVAASDSLLLGSNIAQRPVFTEGLRGPWFGSLHAPVALVAPLQARSMRVPDELADIAMPYPDASGGTGGVLAAHLDAAFFDALRERTLGAPETQRGLQLELTDLEGKLLLGQRAPVSDASRSTLYNSAEGLPTVLEGENDGRVMLVRVGVKAFDAGLRSDWQVVAWQPLDQVLAPVRELELSILWTGGLTALILSVAGFWLSRRLARPYSELLDAVAERLDGESANAPGAVLRTITEQMRRLPRSGTGTRSELALAQLLHDASRLQAMLANLPAPVYLVDKDYRVLFWNRACERVFGWSAAEAEGRHVDEIFRDKDPNSRVRQDLRALMAVRNEPQTFQGHLVLRDGTEVWGDWWLSKVFGVDGEPLGILVQVRDLTAEHQGAERLREQGEVLAAVINAASDAVISVDMDGRINLFNPAAARIFGRSADEMLGQPLDALLPREHRGGHLGLMRRFGESSATTRPMGFGRVKGLRPDGTEIELEASISQVTVRGEKRLTAILRDVSERVRAEQALSRYQVELSELTQRLLHQEQVTTRELAQTLHDQLGQTLGAIRLSFDSVCNQLRDIALPQRAQDRLRTVNTQIDQAIVEVRQALVKLRPPLLEKAGLIAALDNEIRQRVAEADPVRLELTHDPHIAEQRWPEDVEYAAFMVAREAVVNAIEHARGTQIRVRVSGDADRLRLDIGDDGVGLPPELAEGRPGHLGMVGMRERALAIGARLQARARREGGTLITLLWTARPDSGFGALDSVRDNLLPG